MWIIITCTTIITLTYVQAFACIGLALFPPRPLFPFRTRIHSRPSSPPKKSQQRCTITFRTFQDRNGDSQLVLVLLLVERWGWWWGVVKHFRQIQVPATAQSCNFTISFLSLFLFSISLSRTPLSYLILLFYWSGSINL